MSKVKSVKGMRGFVKLAKEIAITATNGNHNNELIGNLSVPLQDIPTHLNANSRWYSLDKRNNKKQRGQIRLKLNFGSEHNAQVGFQEHRHLLRMLLLNELSSEDSSWDTEKWTGPAKVTLAQHAVHRGLTPERVALARWIEFGSALAVSSQAPAMSSFKVFLGLATELRELENWSFTEQELQLFWEATRKILHSGLNALRKIRRLTATNQEKTIAQIHDVIKWVVCFLLF